MMDGSRATTQQLASCILVSFAQEWALLLFYNNTTGTKPRPQLC
jgi:hypothetical protein